MIKKLIIFIVCLYFGHFNVFSQIDSLKLNLISKYLDLEKFNNEHTFYVDTIVKANSYSFYSVTPFTSSYSFCVIFKDDLIIELKHFPNSMSKLPYLFKVYSISNGSKFISTYWYGNGTISSSINYYLMKLSKDGLELVYSDYLYYKSKINDEFPSVNSYDIIMSRNELILIKHFNDFNEVKSIINKYHLPLDISVDKKTKEGIKKYTFY